MSKEFDEILKDAQGKLENGMLIGLEKDGSIFIKSSVTNVPFMHWMLNRSVFELGLYEKQTTEPEDEKAPES